MPQEPNDTDALPSFEEAELIDIWRYRQEWHEQEAYACERRRHADKELYKRLAEKNARRLLTEAGPIEAIYSKDYAYNTAVVDGAFMALIARDELYEQFAHHAQRRYKINRHWLNDLMKLGEEYQRVIDQMTVSPTGSPSLKGPELSALPPLETEPIGEHATAEEIEEIIHAH